MNDADALFAAVAQDLEVGVNRAYDRMEMSDRSPEIRHSHGPSPSYDLCDSAIITMSVARSVPLAFPCATAPIATFRIDLVRCWPAVNDQGIPDLEAEQVCALGLQRDAAALWDLATQCSEKMLITIPELGCDVVRFGDMRPTGPLGGFAGWSWLIDVSIWGIGLGP